jgi:hypothetical protein
MMSRIASSPSVLKIVVAVGIKPVKAEWIQSRGRILGGFFRTIDHIDDLGAWEFRQYGLDEGMIGGAFLALPLSGFGLMMEGLRAGIGRHGDHPPLSGPLLKGAREVVGDRAAGALRKAEFDMAFLEAHEMDIAFEGSLEHDFPLLACHCHHILETAKPQDGSCIRSGGRFWLRLWL